MTRTQALAPSAKPLCYTGLWPHSPAPQAAKLSSLVVPLRPSGVHRNSSFSLKTKPKRCFLDWLKPLACQGSRRQAGGRAPRDGSCPGNRQRSGLTALGCPAALKQAGRQGRTLGAPPWFSGFLPRLFAGHFSVAVNTCGSHPELVAFQEGLGGERCRSCWPVALQASLWGFWRRKVLRKPRSASPKSISAASLCGDKVLGADMADWVILATSLKLFGPWFPFVENGDNSKALMGALNGIRCGRHLVCLKGTKIDYFQGGEVTCPRSTVSSCRS